ncbi:hypothetical protein ABPG74_001822 [Tetrahymena malaccensis]
MFLNPVKDSEFEDEFKGFVPSEGEVRFVANKNKECGYYLQGVEQCRRKMVQLAGDSSSEFHSLGFLPCKRLVDAHYRCMTDDKFGSTIEEVPEIGLNSAQKFFDCTFQQLKPMQTCRRFFDQVVRDVYRANGSQLI